MSVAETKIKDPQAVLDYIWKWRENGWLVEGDEIDTAAFTVYTDTGGEVPDTDTTPVTVDSFTNTPDNATAWISGGTKDLNYWVTCHITTTEGRADDRTLALHIRER